MCAQNHFGTSDDFIMMSSYAVKESDSRELSLTDR
jgi:hypothetical protein